MAEESDRLRIIIADDHAVVREGLRLLLDAEPGFEVVGEAGDLETTERLVRELLPDVLVLDLHMGAVNSLEMLPALREAAPQTGIVVLTMQNDPGFARQALALGAGAYVLKESRRSELVLAVRSAAAGGVYIHGDLGPRALVAEDRDHRLSERETEVLRLLALGYTNAEIAGRMYLSLRTVETHRAKLQRKLGLSHRPDLVRYALDHGVIGT